MDTRDDTSSIEREGYFFTDVDEQLNEEYIHYEIEKKKNKNLNLIRKVVKSYKEDKSPTDVLNKSFRKHDSVI